MQSVFSYENAKGETYYLNEIVVTLRGGNRQQTIHYFSRDVRGSGIAEVPAGFRIVENLKTGLPCLKRV